MRMWRRSSRFDVAAVFGSGVAVHAQPHQLGDAMLGVEHRAAAGFGGMRRDHRRYQGTRQRVGNRRRIQLGRIEFQIRGGQAAVLRRLPCRDVDSAAAFAMDVLGDVGQQREMGERPDDGDGLMDVDAVEHATPTRRGRSRSAARETTRRGRVRQGRTPPRRSARGPCRRGWRRAAGCLPASARWPRDPPWCAVPRRSVPVRRPQPCPQYRGTAIPSQYELLGSICAVEV